ncbi:hypothetical protein [Paenibacillus sp. GCM10027626]|uniref:hypothetical protein n=1 Tax=Paenibacillus sp. GCM10027626 TaxID=3273411 RepID=UPI003645B3EC
MSTKTVAICTAVLFALNLIAIQATDIFTIKMRPGRGISGNGNPGLLLWFWEIPLYLLLLAGIVYLVVKTKFFARRGFFYPFFFLILLLASGYLQNGHAHRILLSIDGKIDEFGAINQYTNTIYINYYSFLIGIFTLLMILSCAQILMARSLRRRR